MGRTLQGYKRLFDDLKKKGAAPLYFLYGPESFIKREFTSAITRSALDEKRRAFNLDVFSGDEFDLDTYTDRMSSFPLFADTRVVLLRRFDALATANKDAVIESARSLPTALVLIIDSASDKLDTVRAKNMEKLARERGVAHKFVPLSETEILERVHGRLRKDKKTIEPAALDLLVTSVGTDLSDLNGEIEKLVLASGDDDTISTELVSRVVGRYRTENVFAFLDEVGATDAGRLVYRINRVIDSGEEPIFVLAMLIRRVLQLLQIRSLLREEGPRVGAPQMLARRMGGTVSPFIAGRLLDQAGRVDEDTLWRCLNNLRWVDVRLKSTALPPRSVIETALFAASCGKTLALTAD